MKPGILCESEFSESTNSKESSLLIEGNGRSQLTFEETKMSIILPFLQIAMHEQC